MDGKIYIILGIICILAAIISLVLALTRINTRKKELRKQWEI